MNGLGVGIVNAENRNTFIDPERNDAQNLGKESGVIIIEVNRVDILILLRWVLRICDGSVVTFGKPLRMRSDPGMIRRALQSKI